MVVLVAGSSMTDTTTAGGLVVRGVIPVTEELVAVVTQVSLGVGVAIVPRVLAECLRMPKVVYRELNGEPIPSELALAYRRHEKAPAAMALIRHIRRSVHQ